MAFSAQQFSSQINSGGLASPNKFRVKILFPTQLASLSQEALNLMCESVNISGRNLNSVVDIQYGIRREVVYGSPAYDPLTLTFLCSQDMNERKKLETWNNFIVKPNSGFDVEFYDNYTGSIEVQMLDKSLTPTYTIQYSEVYPKTITGLEMNHSTTNTTLRLTCSFNYSYYKTTESSARQYGENALPASF